MEVLKVKSIQEWDRYTIENEPIASIDLMERASRVFTDWLTERFIIDQHKILIVVSKGNNGGDGLAVGRMLAENGFDVEILILHIQKDASKDFQLNLDRLQYKNITVSELHDQGVIPVFKNYDLIIDGIFGSGLSRPVSGYWATVIDAINEVNGPTYSIDIPSGMFADEDTPPDATVIHAENCLSFEVAKLSFFFPSNGKHLLNWEVESIGLHPDFPDIKTVEYKTIAAEAISEMIKPRARFDHKGTYGKILIAAGQKGMAGASILCAKAALRSGSGLVNALIPDCNYVAMQTAVPEVMVKFGFGNNVLTQVPDLEPYDAIALGPGLGTASETVDFIENLLRNYNKALVIDADALNIIAEHPEFFELIPPGSILTPHPGEFSRLFGKVSSDLERLQILKEKAVKLGVYIVLKGAFTAIAEPQGLVWFNTSGNPGMATGGSGDVLTGLITGLLGQGYSPEKAVKMGVFIHGMAGDICKEYIGEQAMIASDLLDYIPDAFEFLNNNVKNNR